MNPLSTVLLETELRRYLRRITRINKRERKAREYRQNGLNGPRAMARRARQMLAIERKQFGTGYIPANQGAA